MKITAIGIKSFGCLQQKEIELKDGINVIYGKNEGGKTTLYTFIKSMFFGLRRQRGRGARTDSYSRYEPWENPFYYGGTLRFLCGDRQFRLERGFQKDRASAALVCETDGERLSIGDGDLRMLLGGISESIYENTVSIGQLRISTGQELSMELKNFMANCQNSGDGELNLEETLTVLRKEKRKIGEALAEAQAAREQKEKEWKSRLRYQKEELKKEEENLEEMEKEIRKRKNRTESDAVITGIPIGWNVSMLLVAFAMGTGVALLEGWMRLLPGAAGLILEGILLYLRGRRLKEVRRIRKREHQQKDSRARELERLEFVREHCLEELEEKKTEFINLQNEYEEFMEMDLDQEGFSQKQEALELAMNSILRISGEMQGKIGRQLQERTSQIFRELTGGRYRQVSMDEELKLAADTGERLVFVEQMSRGTMEQLEFALRMAAAEILCQEEPLPIFLDDVFAMYDEARLEAALTWLAECGKQVILCTCHRREAEILKQKKLPYHEILL